MPKLMLSMTVFMVLLRSAAAEEWFKIAVVDQETGRGVPLVELRTVDQTCYVTDSAGLVAFQEPGLMDRTVFFSVRSHGYEYPADGFGCRGVKLKPTPGGNATIKLKRLNVAERLYRITGAGIYRDSMLLGLPAPTARPTLNGEVVGQDSAQAAVYRDKLYWFWGDTSRAGYPLGNFRTSGAVADLPGRGGLLPSVGIDLRYFTGDDGFCRPMCPFPPGGGMIWIDGLLVVPGSDGRPRLLTHYSHMKSLDERLEHGLAEFDDTRQAFDRRATFDLHQPWRCPVGHPLKHTDRDGEYFYFGLAMPNVRVRADYAAVLDAARYEAWTCLADGSSADAKTARVLRDAAGQPVWRWTTQAPPLSVTEERKLLEAKLLSAEEARYQPVDVESGKPVYMHGGSVRWNDWRKRWILVAVQQGGTSFLGEVWYAESNELTGPWRNARKIVTHDRYSFYNPVQREFFDEEGGRKIYFEGTYVNTFSGNPETTPRYDYNQILYRLDLADPRLGKCREGAS
jgi:hypothetical protein